MKNEKVLCVPRGTFDALGSFNGLSTDVDRYFEALTTSLDLTYVPRSEAESNPQLKQLIPYIIVLCGDKILRYRRSKTGGEGRLHGCFSIGIGGHIAEEDTQHSDPYEAGVRRELEEELGLPLESKIKLVTRGIVNDDTNEVGRVHLGIVHVLTVDSESIVGCLDVESPEFVRVGEVVQATLEDYESWSQLCVQNITSLLRA